MKLTVPKKVSKVVHFTDFYLLACRVYSHFEFELKNSNTIFTVSKIQAMRKLNNPSTEEILVISFAGLFLTEVKKLARMITS